MTTSLKENFGQVYPEENLAPGAAASAASENASGEQSHADDCAAIAGATCAELPFQKSNSRVYHSKKKRINVQHFLQATAVIIGIHRF